MESKNKFSIAIPAYKRNYLKEAIDSCLEQTYKNFELIIVNDASPEDLGSIVSLYDDNRIKYYINEKNCGAVNVVDNWNKCLEYATGDYIICMGDDDRLLPCCLEEYDKLIKQYPKLGVYHAWTEIINEKSLFKSITQHRCEYESVYSLIWHRWDNRKHQYIGDFLFCVESLRDVGGFYKLPMAWGSDDITAVICAAKNGIANTSKIAFQYRENNNTISNSGNYRIKLDAIVSEREWYREFLRDKPSDELDTRYWLSINSMYKDHFKSKLKTYIVMDLRSRFPLFGIAYCWRNRNRWSLTFKDMLFVFIKSFKKR